MEQMQGKINNASGLLKGLASSHRLHILCQLIEGEKNVTQLIEKTGIAQTSMSQHLSKLKDENIVNFRREHRTLYYFICHDAARQIMDILYNYFCKEADND